MGRLTVPREGAAAKDMEMGRSDTAAATVAGEQVVARKPPPRSLFRRGDTEHLTRWQLVAFALPTIPLAVVALPAAILLPPYYTGELGLSLTTWALVVLAARVWDAVTDPVVGILSDRLPSRWGRRRHLIVAAAPLVMTGCALLFVPGLFTRHVTPAYVLVGMLILNLGSTITGLNNAAWGAELSSDYHERTRIMGWRGSIGGMAPIVAFGIPAAMEWIHHGAPTAEKIATLGWVSIVLTPIALAVAVISVGEKPRRVVERESGRDLWRSLKILFTNPLLLRILAAQLLAAIPQSVMIALFVFFVTFVLNLKGMAASLLLIPLGASMISIPFWMWIAKGREKHRVVALSYLVMGAVQFGFIFLGRGNVLPFAIIIFVVGICGGATFLQASIMVDIVDSDTAVSGRERAGAFFAVLETITKLAPTLAVTFIFPLLQWFGFDPSGKHNTASSIAVVKYCYAFAPTIPIVIASFLMWRFPLGSREQAELRAQIEIDRPITG